MTPRQVKGIVIRNASSIALLIDQETQMFDRLLWWILPEWLYRKLLDHCEVCGGTMGGVRGNENVVQSCGESVVMCDYCSVWERATPGFWKCSPSDASGGAAK